MVAALDGGAIASNAGALLLGATDRAINLASRFAVCFRAAHGPSIVQGIAEQRGGRLSLASPAPGRDDGFEAILLLRRAG